MFEQAGSTLNLFADRARTTSLLGWGFPSSWYQSLNALFIIIFAPVFAWLWITLGRREPASPTKFAFGLIGVGAGFLVLVPAALARNGATGQPDVADDDLPDSHLAELSSQPGRPQLDDQARAGADRRPDDGRVVSRFVGRQLHRRADGRRSTKRCRSAAVQRRQRPPIVAGIVMLLCRAVRAADARGEVKN